MKWIVTEIKFYPLKQVLNCPLEHSIRVYLKWQLEIVQLSYYYNIMLLDTNWHALKYLKISSFIYEYYILCVLYDNYFTICSYYNTHCCTCKFPNGVFEQCTSKSDPHCWGRWLIFVNSVHHMYNKLINSIRIDSWSAFIK